MELVLATRRLGRPGGPQTYALTVAEHLARLGHGVTLYARELGAMAELARERALTVVASEEALPEKPDGVVVGTDPSLAFELAASYPDAARVYVVHGSDDIHLPPPLPGVVAATVALNDRFAARARASAGAGEVVRLRQPVDIRRFSPRGEPPARPRRVLLLGNYHSGPGERASLLREAWAHAELEWRLVGGEKPTAFPLDAIADADVVVGYGRSILEAMACGRPAYVHDHSGTGGWVTADSYARLEAGGFALGGDDGSVTLERLREDIDAYRPELGRVGNDLARNHHDARDHAAALVALLERHGPSPLPAERAVLRTFAHYAQALLRAEIDADHARGHFVQWFDVSKRLEERLAAEHEARAAAEREAAEARAQLRELRGTRRYRAGKALAAPLDRLRGRGRSSKAAD